MAYSMGIVAYMMLFIGNATALRYLDITLNQSLSMVLSRRRGKWEMKAMSQVGSFLESQAKVARPVKMAFKWTSPKNIRKS